MKFLGPGGFQFFLGGGGGGGGGFQHFLGGVYPTLGGLNPPNPPRKSVHAIYTIQNQYKYDIEIIIKSKIRFLMVEAGFMSSFVFYQ